MTRIWRGGRIRSRCTEFFSPQRQEVSLGLILRQQASALHGGGGEAWHLIAASNDGISLCKRGLHIPASFPDMHRDIAPERLVNEHGAPLRGVPGVHDRWQGLIIDLDAVQDIAGEVAVMCHD